MVSRAGIALAVLSLGACTASTPILDPSDSPSPSASPSASPSETVPPPRAVRAAVVVEDRLIGYEVESDTISELARGGNLRRPSWLSRIEIAVIQDSGSSSVIRLIDIEQRTTTDLATIEGSLLAYDITRDRTVLATMTARDGFAVVELRYLIGERPVQRVTSLPIEARGGSIDDQWLIEFDPAEQRFVVVQTANAGGTEDTAALQVRSLDGSLEFFVDTARGPTAAAWLPPGGLVFRSQDGVRRWKPGRSSSVAIGALSTWYSPWVAPNGRLVAFDTGRVSRRVQVRRVNLRNGAVTDLGPAGRGHPVYAAGNEVWTQIVQRCEPDCFEPFVLGPQVFAINPNNGRERLLALPTLAQIAVWYA